MARRCIVTMAFVQCAHSELAVIANAYSVCKVWRENGVSAMTCMLKEYYCLVKYSRLFNANCMTGRNILEMYHYQ